ncbi:MAG: disulfide oxidoreductase [Thermoleophilia bacterium]|nr:disulfide oxidoreductase [Thermoleophilia bacterium]
MIELLAVLTVVAQAAVAVTLGCWLVQRLSTRRPLDALTALVHRDALRLAALVAIVAMAGSLYMSEVRHFQPCPLCWYQRIAMYPLALVLLVAALRDDRRVGWYALPLAVVGIAVGSYHYQLERFPDQEAIACSSSVPCTTIWFEQFGYITIPMMALSAFALVATLVWLGGSDHGQGSTNEA